MVPLKKLDNSNLARIVYSFMIKGPGPQVWVRVPVSAEEVLSDVAGREREDTWAWWDAFRSTANYEKKMGVV